MNTAGGISCTKCYPGTYTGMLLLFVFCRWWHWDVIKRLGNLRIEWSARVCAVRPWQVLDRDRYAGQSVSTGDYVVGLRASLWV